MSHGRSLLRRRGAGRRSPPRSPTPRSCAGSACGPRAATTRRSASTSTSVWRIPTDALRPERGSRPRRPWTRGAARARSSSRARRTSRGHLKRAAAGRGPRSGRECEMCGQGELWRGRRMSLVLDHVNGVHDDHRLENLRILCPNCNATLDTHCGRHNKRKHADRSCPTLRRSSSGPATAVSRYCSPPCAGRGERSRRAQRRTPPRRATALRPAPPARSPSSATSPSGAGTA